MGHVGRILHFVLLAAFALCVAACSGHQQSNSSSAEATATATATAVATEAATSLVSASPETVASESAPAAPEAVATSMSTAATSTSTSTSATAPPPASTPDPNLLSTRNGTLLRAYAPLALDRMNDGNLRNAAYGVGAEIPSDAKPPYVFTFELTGPATITGLQANLRSAPDGGPTPNVVFAVSSTGATAGFTDIGTIAGHVKEQAASGRARFVRVTANQLFDSVGVTGTIAAPPAGLNPTGVFVENADPDKGGTFVPGGTHDFNRTVRFVAVGSSLVATQCAKDGPIATFIGPFHGRTWDATFAGNKDANPETVAGVVNDESSVIAGVNQFGEGNYFSRIATSPAFCSARSHGTGPHRVLVLDQDPVEPFYPSDASPPVPGYTFERIGAGMLDANSLNGVDAVITRGACKIPNLMSTDQRALLLKWVAAGHKLILGGGSCGNGADFAWLPYPFTSAGPGSETTHAGLIQTENDALGTNDKNDAVHFVDVNALATDENNALASDSPVTTADQHWCGHFFVAKTSNLNGYVQMYASLGNGMLIYDGFNGDDGRAVMQRLRLLELALPVPASLPCSQSATESLILEPNQEATFTSGARGKVHVQMELLANQGWSGAIALKASGDLPATVTPTTYTLAGGTVGVDVFVDVAASTKPGVYTDTVVADNGAGKKAQASVTVTGTGAPGSLKKAFTPKQKRIRIYGIHFDVDSAVIQPRSEPVIAEIAQIMRGEPHLRFQVEGHTDSDGGAAYNLGLSQRRAQSVVNDLVMRDGIARSRLVPKGFGLAVPVASNATASGKALNRRVELLRL